ncbi:putative polysaccharide biosynthesis protein [Vagococcus vulneris]|uniref:Uncharacterized protein n=1 Tax=Vagococcus vulneris TaxID=1977869 RepID=A0A429ZSW6_9ENTE|nr:polysaccharide biosynthesis protein [Vagococcus vulneris]RST96754.1 hypothetical protein CBF37_10660 [Vagococcus vulneris]
MENKSSSLEKKMLRGTLILTVTSFVVKVLSAVYRVPFQNLVGDEGFYVYQQVYPLYGIAMTFALSGLPIYLSKLIAGSQDAAEQQLIISKFLTVVGCLSVLSFTLIYFGSGIIAIAMGDTALRPVIQAVSLVFLIIPFISLYRGYYQGLMEMKPTAISQLVEQSIRVLIILVAGYLFLKLSLSVYQTGTIAMWGAVFGSISGLATLVYYSFKKKVHFSWLKVRVLVDKTFTRKLLTQGGILCVFSAYLILFQLIDSFSVLHALRMNGLSDLSAKIAKGVYDRGQPLVQVGLVVAVSMTATFLPLLTRYYIENNRQRYDATVQSYLKISRVVSSAAAIGLALILPYINQALFNENEGQLTLEIFVLSIFFVSMIQSYQTIYQSQNRVKHQFISAVSGLVVKLLTTDWLTSDFGTLGASVSTLLGLAVCLVMFHLHLHQLVKKSNESTRATAKLLLSLGIMTGSLLIYRWVISLFVLHSRTLALFLALLGVMIGVGSYLTCLIKLAVLNHSEWLMLPLGDKVVKQFKL